MHSVVGTQRYVAPEVLSVTGAATGGQPYDFRVVPGNDQGTGGPWWYWLLKPIRIDWYYVYQLELIQQCYQPSTFVHLIGWYC